jgi:iron complex outermembrane receptor protein
MYRTIVKGLLFVSPFFLNLNNVLAEQNRANELETETIEVISTTPVPGIGISVKKVPSNVKGASATDIDKTNNYSAAEYLEKNLPSVTVGDAQGNIFMPDVSFRGQMASPLLGNPQGLPVYMDGMRVNEGFGDVVRWDLIPQNALSTMSLIPGTNPVFGLNALGGVLALTTKSGFQHPGSTATLSGGSWGRKNVEFEHGAGFENADFFIAGTMFDEDGYRDHSGSMVQQFFGKWGWESGETDFDLSFSWADTKLDGTQALPASMLNNIKQAYTWPDTNDNQLFQLNAVAKHFLDDTTLISGNAYVKHSQNKNVNSNVNDDYTGSTGTSCDGTGDDDEECPGAYEGSNTMTNAYGASIQLTSFADFLGKENTLTYGVSTDVSFSKFVNLEERAYFSSGTDRTLYKNGDAAEAEVGVYGDTHYFGYYVTNVHEWTDTITLTTSGRYNVANVKISDKEGNRPAVAGKHQFHRFNPGIGVSFNPQPAYTTYVSYTEGMRAPTPVELTCADPTAPCKLPNAFLADPPLDAVVGKTFEVGARGSRGDSFKWSAAFYNTVLENDLQFISKGAGTSAGYFDNVGDTIRRGAEVGLGWSGSKFNFRSDYSYIQAEFDSTFQLNSPHNSTASSNEITVRPGNKIPGIPEHTVKLRLEYKANDHWTTALSANYFSKVYARGDENNQDSNGAISGYSVLGLDTSYKMDAGLEFFMQITNLLDEKYETMGILGENYFVNGTYSTTTQSEQFRGIGLPRAAFIGIKYSFGG